MRIVTGALAVVAIGVAIGWSMSAASRPPDRRMVVTVDDLPVGPPGRHDLDQQRLITDGIVTTLAKREVPAVGFVNQSKVEVDGRVDADRVALLERWLQAGFELGNHGHSHVDLHRVGVDAWLDDVDRGEPVLREVTSRRGASLRYFRHPFLHTGTSPDVQRRTARALADRGYTVAPVTVDNGEWIYGDAYADAFNRRDLERMERLGGSYVDYMLDVVAFYEGQAEAIVGRPIPQVLLVHAYALNADHLGRLLDELSARGWTWITLDEALDDPVYRRPTHGYTGPGGITWLHRWAITAGVDRGVFAGEPEVPGWVRDLRR
jgi:peptidoglycan/xylan/chitin deacetylase (PgdA/CDA1 family)